MSRKLMRLDIHQRVQHAMMATSFVLAGLTGWPLRSAEVDTSSVLVGLFGGVVGCQLVHRFAALLMIASSIYHLAYLGLCTVRRRLDLQMLPYPSDVLHVVQNVMFLLGVRRQSPDFGRWTYWEKFDYWAVFWGMAIIGGSGLILWFPVAASWLLPGWTLHIAQIVHGDEALLALLAIFVWHLYNVHLRPGVWPMSMTFVDGMITEEEMIRYHPREHRQLHGDAAVENEPEEGP